MVYLDFKTLWGDFRQLQIGFLFGFDSHVEMDGSLLLYTFGFHEVESEVFLESCSQLLEISNF